MSVTGLCLKVNRFPEDEDEKTKKEEDKDWKAPSDQSYKGTPPPSPSNSLHQKVKRVSRNFATSFGLDMHEGRNC